MCGRYASSRDAGDLADEFEVDQLRIDALLPKSWNVAPTDPVYAVLDRPPRPDRPRERQLRELTWGLVPSWAKDARIGSRLINARMETVADKPAFKRAFAAKRCLLPADGYYEWYETEQPATGKAGRRAKQPFFIRPADGGVLAMAGLYEIWRDPRRPDDDPHPFRWTCTIITTNAEDSLGRIHDRMPLMVERERWDEWLDPTTPATLDLLVPAAPGRLTAYPVTTLVNNVKNNGPELVEPLEVS
ncbi:SOS response-associated peptidase [Nocardioides sp.]|uniref:SOS response-associated peptidase n=1 Tax=Nocardioides sp. TaxID=35761 RepID=UPI0039E44740